MRYNADLANGIGNLASRTSSMLSRYCGGKIPEAVKGTDSGGLPPLAEICIADAIELYRKFAFSKALETIWSLLARTDKYIVEHKPWELARADDSDSRFQLEATLYNTAEALRIACVLLAPVIPTGAQRIWEMLGQDGAVAGQRLDQLGWGGLAPGTAVGAQAAVYPRLDVTKSVESMEALEAEALEEQARLMGAAAPQALEIDTPEIEIGDFAKVDMRVGVVRAAERVKNSRRLLELSVDIGEAEPRTVLAGIAEQYSPDEMVGRRIAVVANLKPRKMMGQLSQGMLIAATGKDGEPHLADFSDEAPIGARLG